MLDDLNLPYTKDFEKLNPIHDQNLSNLIFDNLDKNASKNDILDPITIS